MLCTLFQMLLQKLKMIKICLIYLGATFTAGTMTGAPKIKAMELIAKFEQLKRSFYSGSVGYFSFTKDMDSGKLPS